MDFDGDEGSKKWSDSILKDHGILKFRIDKFRTALEKGLPLANLYSASPQGALDIDLLISGAAATFGHHFDNLPNAITNDYDEAGRSLAFALYTATGFHSARACEAALRLYAKKFMFQPDIDKIKTMGAMIQKLRDVKGNELPDVQIIDRADRIRDLDRNTVMHPGRFLGDFDARSIFAIAGE
jgi:hypothetical protein